MSTARPQSSPGNTPPQAPSPFPNLTGFDALRNGETKEFLDAMKEQRREKMAKLDKELQKFMPEKQLFDNYEKVSTHISTNFKLGLMDIYKKINSADANRMAQLTQAGEEADKFIDVMQAQIGSFIQDQEDPDKEHLSQVSFTKLEKFSQAMSNVAIEGNSPLGQAAEKARTNEPLTPADVTAILETLPDDPTAIHTAKFYAVFTTMQPAAKLGFCKDMIDQKPEKSANILQALLANKRISMIQARELFDYGAEKNVPGIARMTPQMEKDFKETQEFLSDIQQQEVTDMTRPQGNDAMRMLSPTNIVSLGVTAWGILVMTMNTIVAYQKIRSHHGSIPQVAKSLLKNPMMYMGGFAIAGGASLRGGSVIESTKDVVEEILTSHNAPEQDPETISHYTALLNGVYANDPSLGQYLDNGGFQSIRVLREQKVAEMAEYKEKLGTPTSTESEKDDLVEKEEDKRREEGKPHWLYMTADQIVAAEGDPTRKNMLTEMIKLGGEKEVERKINIVAQTSQILGIQDQTAFNKHTQQLRQEQGLA